jgi:hypothetical protein
LADEDYKKFLNFLGTHGCMVDFREFRNAAADRIAVAAERTRPMSNGNGSRTPETVGAL